MALGDTMAGPVVVHILLGAAVALCLLCSAGVLIFRDPFQKLHYSSPIASLAIALIVVAIWINDPDWQARIKSGLIAAALFLTTAVLNHATAQAFRIRAAGQWEIKPDEHIPVVHDHGEVGRRTS
jgi:monovalent cation/proton antiporter MnhG/PhaG subunit